MTVVGKTELVEQIESLPPLPTIVHEVLSVTGCADSSADDVARVLSRDPAIAAKILRVANSPFYGVAREITQISRAVVMLGSIAVRNLVMGICARDTLASAVRDVPEHSTLWRHSTAVASGCELIARQAGFKPAEEAFVAGLLHDIGQLAMVIFQPEAFRAVLREQRIGGRFLGLERRHLGIDHTEAGYQILSQWGLPESLCEVVRRHHAQQIHSQHAPASLLAIVMLADALAQVMGIGLDFPAGSTRRIEASATLLGLSDSDLLRILNGWERRMEEAFEMFAVADAADAPVKETASKHAIWISSIEAAHGNIGQVLLEQHGYSVRRVTPTDVSDDLRHDDLVLLDLPNDDPNAGELLSSLLRRGHGRLVLLADPDTDGPLRQRNPETGVCRISRLFTAFDLKWVEEQVEP